MIQNKIKGVSCAAFSRSNNNFNHVLDLSLRQLKDEN